MRAWIESTFAATVLTFGEFDGECEHYSVLMDGQFILADSLALLLSELYARCGVRELLAA